MRSVVIVVILWLALDASFAINFGPPSVSLGSQGVVHAASQVSKASVLQDVFSERTFQELFPQAHRLYSYDALASVISKLQLFDSASSEDRQRRELAMFLAQVTVETSDLRVVEQRRVASERRCDASVAFAPCAPTKSYHARGPLSLEGNAAYARCSRAIGRGDTLVYQPELVASDSETAWSCALWQWQRDDGLGSCHDAAVAGDFGRTTALLKGGDECGGSPLQSDGDAKRVARYLELAKRLNVVEPSGVGNRSLSCVSAAATASVSIVDQSNATRARLKRLLPATTFARLFPNALTLFSFDSFLDAAAAYPAFVSAVSPSKHDDDDARDEQAKAELAAFLAHVAVKTNNLTQREADDRQRYSDDVFCDPQRAPCVDGRSYHGRGALLLQSNAAYDAFGRETKQDLLRNPDAVARHSHLAWRSAVFQWMTDLDGRGRIHDAASSSTLLAHASHVLYGDRMCASMRAERLAGAASIVVARPDDALVRMEDAVIAAFRHIADAVRLPRNSRYLDDRVLSCRRAALHTFDSRTASASAFTNASALERLLPEPLFARLFPDVDPFFNYHALVDAARQFPRFVDEDSAAHNRRELAAFLTHAALATCNWTWREVPNAALYDATAFCDLRIESCAPNRRYHARGAMPIQWNYNYAKCGAALGVDLLGNPDLVRLDATLAWRAALWVWMEQRPVSPFGSLHAVMHRHLDSPDDNFRLSTQLLGVAMDGTDAVVCASDAESIVRARLFVRLCQAVGLEERETSERLTALQCQPQLRGPRASTTQPTAATTTPLRELISSSQFHAMVDPVVSHPLYSYDAFLAAAAAFPGFAGAANATVSKRELAAFLAHIALASKNFTAIEDARAAAACKTQDDCYHGRGPLMLSGRREYQQFERTSHEPVAEHPNAVLVNADVAWRSAFFVWTARQRANVTARGATTAHEFAQTPFALAGASLVLTPPLCEREADTTLLRTLHTYYARFATVLELEEEEHEEESVSTCLDAAFLQFDAASYASGETKTNTQVLARLLPRELFHELFPLADPLYSYHTFIAAASRFPAFVNDGDDHQNRFELAAFIAQMAHASGSFTFTQQAGASLFDANAFCSKELGDPCNPNERYHGRGPIQLTWNYNYKAYGDSIGVDLVNHPNWVATDATIAWGSALWYWMTPFAPFGGSIHDVFASASKDGDRDFDFARTTLLLNGRLECGATPTSPEPEAQRIAFLKRFAGVFGVAPGRKLSCHSSAYEWRAL
ncbi:hypothetical protein PINS_up006821 [Pythium insidiosum]|nr:hypothetical protein PINS_up006821 [Pythium insidiosum]